jgi:hypothetical protein
MTFILFMISMMTMISSARALSSPLKHIGIRPVLSKDSYAHRSARESGIDVRHRRLICIFNSALCKLIFFSFFKKKIKHNHVQLLDQNCFCRKGSWCICTRNDSCWYTTLSISRRVTYKVTSAIKVLGKAKTKQI